ncbi:hypothetical protein EXIGLDRAFT_800152 [Exidia glandulosa HHB12029]|uniref:T6SS Phospholipase effector Tle1-like catalytic domain-containing protein n=1 Tax=Exidia glandulosa HHB12029 TaxID=1314781 RepID=A0A165MXI4_EXIGL|nr:hypothetical protein EXIGLDRAFT_800152 [Exidia glandulosa HHB12029]
MSATAEFAAMDGPYESDTDSMEPSHRAESSSFWDSVTSLLSWRKAPTPPSPASAQPAANTLSHSEAVYEPCTCIGSRNLVVCIDGTSNQFGKKNTNIVELYQRLVKDETQVTFYNSGIGTYAKPSWTSWTHYKQVLEHKIDLAIAWNFEKIVLSAYHWLSENYEDGDQIYLFGFSRGAYQVRVLSAMIEAVGLIHKGNEDQIPFAYQLYAEMNPPTDNVAMKERFKTTFSRTVRVHFIGVWDTVSSVGIVRDKTLPGTTDGMKHVCYFRHALALHERRVKFLPEYVNGDRGPDDNDADIEDLETPHTKEVWFKGCHSDIGGGAVDNENSDLFGPSLRWMSYEAMRFGLHLGTASRKWSANPSVSESLSGFGIFSRFCP